jgi:hypothetical protein
MVLALASTGRAQQTEALDEAALEAARAASISAQGQYNYNSAAAAREGEEARATAFDTSSRALREYYVRKQVNADYLASKNAATPGLMYRLAEIKRPARLTLGQYSREGKQLVWPAILKDPIFDVERHALDEAFAQRGAFDAGTDSHFYRLVSQLSKQMREKVVDSIDQISTTDSISARKFLRSLEFEARILPDDLGGLATSEP